MGQLSLLIVLTWRYIELQSITPFVEFVDLLGCTHFYFFFSRLLGTKKFLFQHLYCFFFGTLYCSNYYSIKSKPVPVVITVVNNNIVARGPGPGTRCSLARGPRRGVPVARGLGQSIPVGEGSGQGVAVDRGPGRGVPVGRGLGQGVSVTRGLGRGVLFVRGPGRHALISRGPGREVSVDQGPGRDVPVARHPGGGDPIAQGQRQRVPVARGPGQVIPVAQGPGRDVPVRLPRRLTRTPSPPTCPVRGQKHARLRPLLRLKWSIAEPQNF